MCAIFGTTNPLTTDLMYNTQNPHLLSQILGIMFLKAPPAAN